MVSIGFQRILMNLLVIQWVNCLSTLFVYFYLIGILDFHIYQLKHYNNKMVHQLLRLSPWTRLIHQYHKKYLHASKMNRFSTNLIRKMSKINKKGWKNPKNYFGLLLGVQQKYATAIGKIDKPKLLSFFQCMFRLGPSFFVVKKNYLL